MSRSFRACVPMIVLRNPTPRADHVVRFMYLVCRACAFAVSKRIRVTSTTFELKGHSVCVTFTTNTTHEELTQRVASSPPCPSLDLSSVCACCVRTVAVRKRQPGTEEVTEPRGSAASQRGHKQLPGRTSETRRSHAQKAWSFRTGR